VNPATRLALAAALIAGTLAPGRGIQAAAAQAAADAPFTLTLSIAGEQRQFRPGEIIPLELTSASTSRALTR
jgi:hypothetical protein